MRRLFFLITRVAAVLCLLSLLSAPSHARELRVIFSSHTPPYVFETGDGIVVDIVKAALEPAGYTVVPVYVPIGRGFEMFVEGRVDGTAIIRENSGLAANYSEDFMQYHNFAFTLKDRNLRLGSLNDLKGKTVVAFQNAAKYLGEDFGDAVANNPSYKEIANQETQVLMLLLGRIDVAVMDEGIFRFYREKLISEGRVPDTAGYEAFDLFEPTPYKTAFVDPVVRDHFNRGLEEIRRSGVYEVIFQKYVERYFEVKR
ncbi:substrate-binding periplasmic protein [Novispirillum sp. DQ9]|uniref:substrate-binding periplasmic protein n=1 Tax=Novispirillum sp. DQ9 TaxID=3398612 RepID=UPI003C7DC2E9